MPRRPRRRRRTRTAGTDVVRILEQAPLDDIATGILTGTVGEPSFAATAKTRFVTGNWYATRSGNAGASWQVVDPFSEMASPRGRFCCDQVVQRVAGLFVWYLQYEASGGSNIVRIAVSRTAKPGSWRSWDLAPTDLTASWRGLWFDYPDLAVSDGHLWLSSNLFDAGDHWKRAVVVRWPLGDLGQDGTVHRQHWSTTSAGSLKLVAGAGATMWFASSDQPRRRLRLFSWPDATPKVSTWDIPVTAWNDSDYTSITPGNGHWLEARCDDRVTAAWRSRGRLGFHWSAGRMTGRPHPFVRSVVLDEASLHVVAEPDLWSDSAAWAYPGAAVNRSGRAGLAAYTGGPTQPALAVGRVVEGDPWTWDMAVAATSTHAPATGAWGDYLTVRPHPTRRASWMAVGATLQGGSDRRFVEPRLVSFSA
jgi:hypothetical protein